MNIATLFARIGINADTKKTQTLLEQLKGIKIGLGIATISIAAFSYGIKKLMDDAIQTAFALKQFNAETGLSTEKLQRWQNVADEVNNSGQAVAESIKAIVSNQEKIKLGMGNISGYQLIGIDPRQDPFKILEELRIKTRGLSQGMKKNILEQMGVSKNLIQVLELSKDKFDALAKGAFIIPKGAIDLIDQARASSKKLGNAVKYLKAMIAANLSPSIIKLNKQIMIWIRQNQEGIIKTVKKVFYWITKFTGAIINAVKMINQIVVSTVGWKNAIYALIGILAILNASLIASPLGLFIAGMLALILILDDLYMYSKGKKSLFGIMVKEFPNLEKGVKKFATNLKEALKDFVDIIVYVKENIKTLIDLLTGKITVKEAFGLIGEHGEKISDEIKENLKSYLVGEQEGGFWNWENIKKRLFMPKEEILQKRELAGSRTKTITIKTDVNVNGKVDEDKLAEKIAEKQQKEINRADEELGGE